MNDHLNDEFLSALADDELSQAERERAEVHLAGCEQCRTRLEGFRAIRRRMAGMDTVPDGPDIRHAVLERLRRDSGGKRRFGSWKARLLVTTPVLAVIIVLSVLQPWSGPLSPASVLAKAYAAIENIKSYRFSMTMSDPVNGVMGRYDVEYQAPDRYHVVSSLDGTDRDYIIIGTDLYYKGEYDRYYTAQGAAGFTSLVSRQATTQWLDLLKDVQDLGEETIGGVVCRHYQGTYDYEKVIRTSQPEGFPPLSEQEVQERLADYQAKIGVRFIDLWIGKDDYLMRKAVLVIQPGPEAQDRTAHTVIYTFSDFNGSITVAAPVDAAGNLLPDWHTTVPDEPAFGQTVTVDVNNHDPSNRVVTYHVTLENISGETIRGISMTVLPIRMPNPGIWTSHKLTAPGIYTSGGWERQPGQTLDFDILFGYDATSEDPAAVAAALESSGLQISYVTPDNEQKTMTVRFQAPPELFTLPTMTLPVHELQPAGEYRINEYGASSAGRGLPATIGGRNYLFLEVQTQNSEVPATPGILVLDITDPASPQRVSWLAAREGTAYLSTDYLDGTVLYVPADGALWTIDVSSPAAPRTLGWYEGISVREMVVNGDYAYVDVGDVRIAVLDVSDPAAPVQTGSVAVKRPSFYGLGMAHGYLLAWSEDAIEVIDVSDPTSPAIVAEHRYNAFPDGWIAHEAGRTLDGDLLYITLRGDDENGVLIVDYSNPLEPVTAGYFPLVNREPRFGGLYVHEGRLYLPAQSTVGISSLSNVPYLILDVSDPADVKELGLMRLPDPWDFFDQWEGGSSSSMAWLGNYLCWFIGNSPNQPVLEVFDISGLP